jgi:hypothetical protein
MIPEVGQIRSADRYGRRCHVQNTSRGPIRPPIKWGTERSLTVVTECGTLSSEYEANRTLQE